MKKLLRYLSFVLITASAALMIMTIFAERSLKHQKEYIFGKLNKIFTEKENYDALFLGSSRILAHVNPRIVDSVLNINSFNAGFDGISIIESKMLLNAYIKKHPPPKLLVLNIDLFSLNIYDTTQVFNFPAYFPYMDDPDVKKTLHDFSPASRIVSVLPFLKLAFFDDFKKQLAIKAVVNPDGNPENIFYKGYSPRKSKWEGEQLYSKSPIPYTQKGLNLFKDILDICSSHKIKVVVMYAPQTSELTDHLSNFNVYKNLIKETCRGSGAVFYDYSLLPITKNRSYFYNHTHLTSDGADIFSTILATDLKKVLK